MLAALHQRLPLIGSLNTIECCCEEAESTIMLYTSRLTLRPYEVGDFPSYVSMTAEPEVYRFLAGKPLTEKEAWSRLLMYIGHWSAFGYGFFAVFDRSTGDYLGETGLARFRRGIGAAFDNLDEAGWVFSRRVHGQGIAYEAAAAVHHWYEQLWSKPTFCLIPEENMSSFRMAEKLGYQRDAGFQDCEGVALLERQHRRI